MSDELFVRPGKILDYCTEHGLAVNPTIAIVIHYTSPGGKECHSSMAVDRDAPPDLLDAKLQNLVNSAKAYIERVDGTGDPR